jgi:hypothetical protein
VTNGFALILAPGFARLLFPAVFVPAFIGEASLCVWLLAAGVNVEKWSLRTGAAAGRIASAAVHR